MRIILCIIVLCVWLDVKQFMEIWNHLSRRVVTHSMKTENRYDDLHQIIKSSIVTKTKRICSFVFTTRSRLYPVYIYYISFKNDLNRWNWVDVEDFCSVFKNSMNKSCTCTPWNKFCCQWGKMIISRCVLKFKKKV